MSGRTVSARLASSMTGSGIITSWPGSSPPIAAIPTSSARTTIEGGCDGATEVHPEDSVSSAHFFRNWLRPSPGTGSGSRPAASSAWTPRATSPHPGSRCPSRRGWRRAGRLPRPALRRSQSALASPTTSMPASSSTALAAAQRLSLVGLPATPWRAITEPLPPIASTSHSPRSCRTRLGRCSREFRGVLPSVERHHEHAGLVGAFELGVEGRLRDGIDEEDVDSTGDEVADLGVLRRTSLSALVTSRSSMSSRCETAYSSSATIWARHELPTNPLASPIV